MTKVLFALLVGALVLCSRQANAQVVVEFKILPPGKELTLQNSERVRYYVLKEWLELASYDAELFARRRESQLLEQELANLQVQIQGLENVIKALESDKVILDDRANRLESKWKACEEELANHQDPIWPYVVGIAGGIVGIVGVTFGVAYGMAK